MFLQHLQPCASRQWPLVAGPGAVTAVCSRLRTQNPCMCPILNILSATEHRSGLRLNQCCTCPCGMQQRQTTAPALCGTAACRLLIHCASIPAIVHLNPQPLLPCTYTRPAVLLLCCPAVLLSPCPTVPQTASRSPLLAALHPLALIDLLSFAPSLLGALLPEYTIAPWGWDLRWFRVFRWGRPMYHQQVDTVSAETAFVHH